MTSYHFAILRYVHDVSTEEFVNIGVVMWISERSQLLFRVNERFSRLSCFFKDIDGHSYRQMVRNLKRASHEVATGDIFKDAPNHPFEIFHEIVQEDASCFQWSRLMSGISKDAEERFKELFEEFVTFYESPAASRDHEALSRRSEPEIWKNVRQALKAHYLDKRVDYDVRIEAPNYDHIFKLGWNNGTRQVLEPISFALKDPTRIVDKANIWSGRLFNLSKGNNFGLTAVISRPGNENMEAFNASWAILKSANSIREIITLDQVNDYMSEIAKDLPIQHGGKILI